MPHFSGFAETACRASFVADMVCSSSATPAFYVDGFALPLAH